MASKAASTSRPRGRPKGTKNATTSPPGHDSMDEPLQGEHKAKDRAYRANLGRSTLGPLLETCASSRSREKPVEVEEEEEEEEEEGEVEKGKGKQREAELRDTEEGSEDEEEEVEAYQADENSSVPGRRRETLPPSSAADVATKEACRPPIEPDAPAAHHPRRPTRLQRAPHGTARRHHPVDARHPAVATSTRRSEQSGNSVNQTPKQPPRKKKKADATPVTLEDADEAVNTARKPTHRRVSFSCQDVILRTPSTPGDTPYNRHFPPLSPNSDRRQLPPRRSPTDLDDGDAIVGATRSTHILGAGLAQLMQEQEGRSTEYAQIVQMPGRPASPKAQRVVSLDGDRALDPHRLYIPSHVKASLRGGLNKARHVQEAASGGGREPRREGARAVASGDEFISQADFINAGERLVEAIWEFFVPRNVPTSSLTKWRPLQSDPVQVGFCLQLWRYRTYNAEIITAFVETPNFDVSRWQRDLWDDIGERDRMCKWEGVEKKIMLMQREHSPSRRPPRNMSPAGDKRSFRSDGKTETKQKQKSKAKDSRCMYCGTCNKHDSRDCDAKKGKWCVQHTKNNMFCPPIESLRICWAFNGSGGCSTSTTCRRTGDNTGSWRRGSRGSMGTFQMGFAQALHTDWTDR
ncbi:hypothetical protein B0H10DRAFT_1945374 [Mycena sp. CBHHK59/15]|nr:hypothetical protein B0H10DRAFT_1945374 [Mycena sp. CBHHK59/15]